MAPASGASAQQPPRGTGLGIRLLEAPVTLRDDPRAQVYIVDRVAPGTTLTRRFEVVNDTPDPLDPELYVARAAIGDETFGIDRRGRQSELTRWSTVEPRSVHLEPGASAQAKITIAVPKDAKDGEYYGGLVAAVVAPGDIQQESRVAVRIYLSVGKGSVRSDFSITKLTASRRDDGRPIVTATVRNTGERALDMGGDLGLSNGPGGVKAGPFAATVRPTLGIGESGHVLVVLDKATPAGPWDALLTLRSGTIERSVEGRITFPDIGERPEDVEFDEVQKKRAFGAVAGSLIILLLAVLLAVVWRVRRSRRRSEED